ncbi:MAG: Alpha-D-ribose 1-methylphosphonate 5-triphosphate synthase subunit PhnG [Candidatus Celerinatantimonas neptuna]|nr:MAG: Alpha-D-ribose 1-methylphosphonate 5-triphosphate synthase subunit PhnG [Candidatus Celerinatantimonas neptuna]
MNEEATERQKWLAILAKASEETLLKLSESIVSGVDFQIIRAPQVGLTQVQGRMGGSGNPFFLGEVTMTRCVVKGPSESVGMGFVAGRSKPKALRVAQLDALLMHADYQSRIHELVLTPLETERQAYEAEKCREYAASKVDFFTLVRGDE